VATIWAMHRTPPFAGPVRLYVGLQPRLLRNGKPGKRRIDLDNAFKAALDALQACGAYQNDRQVTDMHAQVIEGIRGGGLLVCLEPDDRKLACL